VKSRFVVKKVLLNYQLIYLLVFWNLRTTNDLEPTVNSYFLNQRVNFSTNQQE